ncbi:MAG TPA: hypothetical protein VFS67_32110 [Polyangiaceae bacterium]|jgi:hypothetical protein|nr:hypothetical protein [Polyangiaceae bacterium]
MPDFRRPAAFLLSASLLSAPLHAAGDAPAQEAGRNPAAAQALFEEAQRGVGAGDYEQACPKFKASYELDPAGGTLLNLADCLEKQGRSASAWSAFKDALVAAQRDGRSERVEYAQQHIRALEPKLSYLTVEVPASSSVGELSVHVDGTPLAAAAWGTALPVDPGEHVLHAEAPGFEPLDQKLTIGGAGAREVFTLPSLRASRTEAAAAVDAQPVMAEERSHPARTWAWISGGVGVAALGVGSYFGVKAFADWDDRNAACVGGCTPAAKAAGDDANRAATIATIGVSAGVVLLGAATVLFFYSSDADPGADVAARLSITPLDQGASISWGGQF